MTAKAMSERIRSSSTPTNHQDGGGSGFPGVLLEELHDEGGRLGGILMVAGVDEGHERGVRRRRIDRAALVPVLSLVLAAVQRADRGPGLLLPLELHELVLLAGDVEDRTGLGVLQDSRRRRRRRRDRRE